MTEAEIIQQLTYDYVAEKCSCKRPHGFRSYSACITLCGYDHQEFGARRSDAINNLATALSKMKNIQQYVLSNTAAANFSHPKEIQNGRSK